MISIHMCNLELLGGLASTPSETSTLSMKLPKRLDIATRRYLKRELSECRTAGEFGNRSQPLPAKAGSVVGVAKATFRPLPAEDSHTGSSTVKSGSGFSPS